MTYPDIWKAEGLAVFFRHRGRHRPTPGNDAFPGAGESPLPEDSPGQGHGVGKEWAEKAK
ncbi:MAG: hypothetical protein Q4F50_18585 [Bacteroides sp.]|uniref:hypothetical protein n=1 Tax=Bacteroides sp. TaxID=29523 RepID=UPI0026DF5703|nr:hypothetical protein [Bacteroides sp.]MDO5422039.1 hypothetical protein [Bacteroides sp.]